MQGMLEDTFPQAKKKNMTRTLTAALLILLAMIGCLAEPLPSEDTLEEHLCTVADQINGTCANPWDTVIGKKTKQWLDQHYGVNAYLTTETIIVTVSFEQTIGLIVEVPGLTCSLTCVSPTGSNEISCSEECHVPY